MARAVVLGNGGLTVGLDENGLVHDFYYPYVGLENLTTARSKPHYIGVWVDEEFSWLHEESWHKTIDFETQALVSALSYTNQDLGVTLQFQDFVDHHHDVFARKIVVKNLKRKKREVRLFFHQVFQISALGRADTVMYVPDGSYMLDYKGRCSILAYAETASGVSFDQYAAGNAGIEGKEGTYRDAEDGVLSMSAVEHGGVDSTIRLAFSMRALAEEEVHYWLVVGDSQQKLESIHQLFIGEGFTTRLQATYQHWNDWLSIGSNNLPADMSDIHKTATLKSLMVIRAHIDQHGGIIASCDSSIYNYGRDYYSYVWPRDGAYAIWPLIKLGYTLEARRFFTFCAHIMHENGYMMHKYQPDSAIGSTWHPLLHGNSKELAIQEDETAVLLCMLAEYEKYSNDLEFVDAQYGNLVKPAADFLSRFIDNETGLPHASYDLWEEKFLTSTYTTATVHAGLRAAIHIATRKQDIESVLQWKRAADLLLSRAEAFVDDDTTQLVKGFLQKDNEIRVDRTLDVSSFYGVWMYGYRNNKNGLLGTLKAIEETLYNASPSGGSPRYTGDNYFKSEPAYQGNPWFVTTLWLGQYYSSVGQNDKAQEILAWTLKNALPSGVLSEQVHPETGAHVSVTPLVWSHAELINLVLAISR